MSKRDVIRTTMERVIPFCDHKTLVNLIESCRWARTYILRNFYLRDTLIREDIRIDHRKYHRKYHILPRLETIFCNEIVSNFEKYLIVKKEEVRIGRRCQE